MFWLDFRANFSTGKHILDVQNFLVGHAGAPTGFLWLCISDVVSLYIYVNIHSRNSWGACTSKFLQISISVVGGCNKQSNYHCNAVEIEFLQKAWIFNTSSGLCELQNAKQAPKKVWKKIVIVCLVSRRNFSHSVF